MAPDAGTSPKFLEINRAVETRLELASDGRTLVHCHGCFDIVHPGHIRHLQHARRLGDALLVSITADVHVGKGDGRPLFDQRLRAENLAALSCVDWVVINPEPTAESLLERLRPDVYVKGKEYEHNEDPRFIAERDAVERHGGRIVFSSGDIVFSSSALVDAIADGGDADDARFEDPTSARLRQLAKIESLSPACLSDRLASVRGKRVLVVGEAMLDTYVQCAWPEVSGESPTLSLRPVSQTCFDGGAAVVARHLAAAGARPILVTGLPRSPDAEAMRERLELAGVEVRSLVVEAPLAEKQRLLVGRDKLVKIDRSAPITLDARSVTTLLGAAKQAAMEADAAIVTDYGLGLLGQHTVADLFPMLREQVDVLAGDVSGARASLLEMREADWLSPSERELRGVVGDAESSLPATAWQLFDRTRARHVVVTLAGDGLVAFRPHESSTALDGQPARLLGEPIPAMAPHVIDPLGCGDALLAYATLALLGGAGSLQASYLGSIAAAQTAQHMGNAPVAAERVIQAARRLAAGAPSVREVGPRLAS
ncbi:MAG: PfkB family carbohydrate kinase [Planctomycetota bacterium]